MARKMETAISEEECEKALNSLGNEKSLCWDGIKMEFFIKFWDLLKGVSVCIANRAFLQGKMEGGVAKGLVKLIPKQTCCSQLKHWRPITMMTMIYKIVAKVLANRLSLILDKVISPHQHGFIKGWSIFYNILTALIGMEYAVSSK